MSLDNLQKISEIQQLTELLLAEQDRLNKDFIRAMTTLARCSQLCKRAMPPSQEIIWDKWLQTAQMTFEDILKTTDRNITTLLQAMQVELETLPQRN